MTGKQRRYLRGLAHHLSPIVMVGRRGVTASVVRQVEQALEDHELIKVKVLEECPVDNAEASAVISMHTECAEVGRIGRVLILYRPRRDGPTIRLPEGPTPEEAPNPQRSEEPCPTTND